MAQRKARDLAEQASLLDVVPGGTDAGSSRRDGSSFVVSGKARPRAHYGGPSADFAGDGREVFVRRKGDHGEPEADPERGKGGDSAPPGSEGHRARMRERLLKAGPEALADHEMLEMVLFLALPRRDTKSIARALLARFRSFSRAIAAPVADLRGIEGLGEAGAAALKTVQAAALRLARAEVVEQPLLSNWDRLMDYLNAAIAREPVEQFRVLYLDTRNRLLADEAQARGTVNHTPVYPREVVKRAMELHATAMILVHNHPSGDPSPSAADVEMTREVQRAAATLSVLLHDHIIVGNGRWTSFRQEGLL